MKLGLWTMVRISTWVNSSMDTKTRCLKVFIFHITISSGYYFTIIVFQNTCIATVSQNKETIFGLILNNIFSTDSDIAFGREFLIFILWIKNLPCTEIIIKLVFFHKDWILELVLIRYRLTCLLYRGSSQFFRIPTNEFFYTKDHLKRTFNPSMFSDDKIEICWGGEVTNHRMGHGCWFVGCYNVGTCPRVSSLHLNNNPIRIVLLLDWYIEQEQERV